MSRRAAILSYSLGTGHRRVAELLVSELGGLGVEASHSALEEWVPWDYDLLFRRGYLLLALRWQRVWDWMYASPAFSSREALGLPTQRRRAARAFAGRGFPAAGLVVATQYNAMEVAADWKKFYGGPLALAAVLTDYDLYPLWVRPEVDLFLVPHEELRDRLASRGVEPGRVAVTGLPIAPAFEAPRDGRAVRESLGLRAEGPVVLVAGGGLGSGPMEEAVRACLQAQGWRVVAVCGRNEALRRALVPLAQAEPGRLRVLGYRDDMPDLLAASDVVVTKGGGLSLTEALYAGKAVVALPGLPGQERANIAFMAGRGWVTACEGPWALQGILERGPAPLPACPLPPSPAARAAAALAQLVL